MLTIHEYFFGELFTRYTKRTKYSHRQTNTFYFDEPFGVECACVRFVYACAVVLYGQRNLKYREAPPVERLDIDHQPSDV